MHPVITWLFPRSAQFFRDFPGAWQSFGRGVNKFTRMMTFAGLAISGVWGVMAWWLGEQDPAWRRISLYSGSVHASVVSFPSATYRQAVDRDLNDVPAFSRRPLDHPYRVESVEARPAPVAPRVVPENTQPLHVMPWYAQLPSLPSPSVPEVAPTETKEAPTVELPPIVVIPDEPQPVAPPAFEQLRDIDRRISRMIDEVDRQHERARQVQRSQLLPFCPPARDECWR